MSHNKNSSDEKFSSSHQVNDEKPGQGQGLSLHAESKTMNSGGSEGFSHSLQPPPPPNEEKKHWSTTEDGALVARATAHVYRAIIATQQQGGMRDFLEEKCGLFLDISGEQSLDCTLAFQVYEKHIETSLEGFAKTEGKTPMEVMRIIESISGAHKMAAKNLDMLLAATGYNKTKKKKQSEERGREAATRQDRAVHDNRRVAAETSMGKDDDINNNISNSNKNNNEEKDSDAK